MPSETFPLFKKTIITDHKGRWCRLALCGGAHTGVLGAGTCWATTCSNTNQSSFSARSPLPSSWGLGRLLVFTVLCRALGTSLGYRPQEPRMEAGGGGCGCRTAQDKARGIPGLAESAKALLFMFRLDHPLRILLKGGFHGWKRFEKSQLYLKSVSAKAK